MYFYNLQQDQGEPQLNRKVFVGRCSEDMTADDLRTFFSRFGEVIDVFIPKPFRAFAFVTFAEPEVAQKLCGDDFIINNTSVHVSSAAPKNHDRNNDQWSGCRNQGNQNRYYSNGGGGGYGGGHGRNDGGGNWQAPPGSQGMNNGNANGGHANMPNMGNFGNMGPFQLNPAMVAAALQNPWGPLLNMVSQANNPNMVGGDNPMNKGGSGNFGNFGPPNQGNMREMQDRGNSGFMKQEYHAGNGAGNGGGWNSGPPNNDSMNSQPTGWGQPPPQQGGNWN